MQIELKAEIGGFIVPSALPCRVQDSGNEILHLQSLKALPPDVLSALCDKFRADVFAQAGVSDPREAEPPVGGKDLRDKLVLLDYYVSRQLESAGAERVRTRAAYQKTLDALQEALS